jgi:hypothetical protein
MWSTFKSTCLCLGLVLAIGCNPPINDKRDFAEALLLTDTGRSTRGSQMGQVPAEVKEKERFTLMHDSDSLLIYEGEVPYDERDVRCVTYYSFDDYGLFEVQFDIYPPTPSDAEKVFAAIKGKLTLVYGRPYSTGTGWSFSTFSPSNNVIEITLTDESAEAGVPFISLNFIEPLDDEV